MDLVRHASGESLLARAGTLLESAEAENNLQLGLAARLRTAADVADARAFLATIEEDGTVVAAVLWIPPHPLTVSRAPADAVAALVRSLQRDAMRPSRVVAPAGTAETFARLHAEATGAGWRVSRDQRIYELTQVVPPRTVPGAIRHGAREDVELVASWIVAFADEATEDRFDPDDAREEARARIDRGDLYVWEDGAVVSMAGTAGPTRHGIRVNLVYTPPEHRGRGYASACVAALSQRMLDSGRRYCFLYTDLANPTSNHIYQAIGYRPVADVTEIRVQP